MTLSDEPITIPTESELTEWIDGAWVRSGRRLDGGPFDEPAAVFWLTVSPYFCDIRVLERNERHPNRLDISQAFSGRVSVEENVVTWRHDLDTVDRGTDHSFSAPVIGHHAELLEIGEKYEERWVRSTATGVATGVAEIDDDAGALFARVIRVGRCAIAVWAGPTPGGALLEHDVGWESSRTVGGAAGDLDLCGVAEVLDRQGTLRGTWRRVG